jgi:pimeloyl-ACP methyl ester carboxylesterase
MTEIRANVRTTGRGPAVVLLHSSGSSGRQWDPLVERLRDRFRLHAVDLHGHGGTPAWLRSAPMKLADEAALLAPLLNASGGAHLVGHSYGGAVALKAAVQFPHLVRSVAVYEPVLFRMLFTFNRRDRAATELRIAADSMRHWLAHGMARQSAQRFVDFWSGSGAWDALPPVHQEMIASRMPSIMAHFDALYGDSPSRRELAELQIPALYLTGARTRLTTRRIGELLQASMPKAAHERLQGMGHMGPVTHADIVAERIARHLDAQAAADRTNRALVQAA